MSVPRRHFRFFFSFEICLNEFRSYINDFIDEFSLRVHLFRILRYKRQGFLDFLARNCPKSLAFVHSMVYFLLLLWILFSDFPSLASVVFRRICGSFSSFFLQKWCSSWGCGVVRGYCSDRRRVFVQKSASQPEISSGGVSCEVVENSSNWLVSNGPFRSGWQKCSQKGVSWKIIGESNRKNNR